MSTKSNEAKSSLSTFRHFYAKYVAEGARHSKDRIRLAFASVERECFVGPVRGKSPCLKAISQRIQMIQD